MIAYNRTNLQGRAFRLVQVFGPVAQTSIRTGDGQQIIVNQFIRDIGEAWHLWVLGAKIEDAFHFLTPEERAFLQKGGA